MLKVGIKMFKGSFQPSRSRFIAIKFTAKYEKLKIRTKNLKKSKCEIFNRILHTQIVS